MPTKQSFSPSRDELQEELENWLQEVSPQARALWAKSGDETGYLNLPQHLADVAAAALEVFDRWVSMHVKEHLAGKLGISVEELRRLVIWLSGIHDVGKAIRPFQRQIEHRVGFEHIVAAVGDAGLPLQLHRNEHSNQAFPHSAVSAEIFKRWLKTHFGTHSKLERLSAVLEAHHGTTFKGNKENIAAVLEEYEPVWVEVHEELMDGFTDVLDIHPVLRKLNRPRAPQLQLLTGIVVFADWIGSNSDAFPMVVKPLPQRLEFGMGHTDLTAPWLPSSPGEDINQFFQDAFGWPSGYSPRSVQQTMVEAAGRVEEPALFILEAETGVGKTEAALAAAQVIGRSGKHQGVYFAAPTMATANGLLQRTIDWADRTTDESVASMYLAHSKNQLADPYQALRYRDIEEDDRGGTDGRVFASQWMSGRRRGLLSNIVVGTVDQVLMMALQQRYSMLRHLALAGKIIIFDEVHSYDAYTSDYLKTTLEWLAYYGATVIVMTATLPEKQRSELAEAYSGRPLEAGSDAYPRITVVTEKDDQIFEPEISPTNLDASISTIGDSIEELQAVLEELLVDGGCALVICNTIARAQDAYRHLVRIYPGETELYHAGFMVWERSEREDQLRKELGPEARRGAGRPERKIVVATQVAEQSLDIDADVLVTDIAPMDLIIQRIGRVHRHERPKSDRPKRVQDPQVYVRGIVDQGSAPELDGGAMAIYDPKILLATLRYLPERFKRPDDIASLVAKAYADDVEIPDEWEKSWTVAESESQERINRAHHRSKTYRINSAFAASELEELFGDVAAVDSLGDEERGAAQVRDSEPTVEVIPIMETTNGYRPLGDGFSEIHHGDNLTGSQARRLAMSTVRLPALMTRFDSDFDAVVSALEESTPPAWQGHFLLKGQLALVLDDQGKCGLGRWVVRYSSEYGLESMFDTVGSCPGGEVN